MSNLSSSAAICIPVRNERRNLPGLYAALARLDEIGAVLVAMVFDACSDGSDAISAELAHA